ncbi:helix-turn-helix domain-containing protein [Castellaniella sp.]|uniref:helix-turn-helix domain-containing protein n=1 Tax=Castellaniella sp. TaxID=1955812 RepID=UPI003A8EA574
MDQILSIVNYQDIAQKIAQSARQRRLAENLSRKSLAARSGVPEGTIKRFETTGEIGVMALLKLAQALGNLDDFKGLFASMVEPVRLKDIVQPARKRGRG